MVAEVFTPGRVRGTLAVAAVHLSAVIYNAHLRKLEIFRLDEALKRVFPEVETSRLILGDCNMHSEAENSSIPPGYSDVWVSSESAKGDPGYTVRAEQ